MVSISAADAARGSPGYRSVRCKVAASTINLIAKSSHQDVPRMQRRLFRCGAIHLQESGDAGGARTLRNPEQCERAVGRPRPRTRGKKDRHEKSRPVPFSARAGSESEKI